MWPDNFIDYERKKSEYFKEKSDYYERKSDYIQKMMEELSEKQNTYTVDQLKRVDVSSSLSDDVRAKLQLLYGDFIIIPVDKL